MLTRATTRPRYQFVHYLILGLSLTVVGMFYAAAIPADMQMMSLQIGLIGLLAFVGLPRASLARQLKHPINAPHVQFVPSRSVEQRLDRIMAEPVTRRIDQADSAKGPGKVKITEQAPATIRIGRN
jgi:hypothetical protein